MIFLYIVKLLLEHEVTKYIVLVVTLIVKHILALKPAVLLFDGSVIMYIKIYRVSWNLNAVAVRKVFKMMNSLWNAMSLFEKFEWYWS